MARVPVLILTADPATGAAIAGATARIRHAETGADMATYAARTGPAGAANPVVSDAYGRGLVFVDRAPLRIDYAGTGVTPWTEYRDAAPTSDRGIDDLWLPAGARPTLVSALPSAPVDGQEVYYLVDSTASTGGPFLWHLRYRTTNPDGSAYSGAYKWEVVGDPPPLVKGGNANNGVQTANTVTFTTLSGSPSIVVPLAGDYDVEWGYNCSVPTGVTAEARTSAAYNGTPFGHSVLHIGNAQFEGGSMYGFARTMGQVAVAAGGAFTVRGSTNNVAMDFGTVTNFLKVKPIRVG